MEIVDRHLTMGIPETFCMGVPEPVSTSALGPVS